MTGASSRRKVHEAVTLNKVVGSHLTPSLAVLDALQLGQGLSVFKHQATTVTSSSLLVQHLDGLDPLLANSMATGALKEKTALLIHPSTSNSAAATTTATTTTTTTTTTASSSTTSAASPPTMLLLDAATDYYHGERTATLALTAALLRAAEDPAHGWCATANEFIQRQNITASATATAAAAATTW